ncbi:46 kDa FK506-binding nuclear protein-like [Mytilus californianus]|uniref:46 kDa FK506-binding nuclear protein-like n=1 Tax=Mytilus californianus TaxID=6549 RepID=UPI002247DBCB|nr:46 kDa FK506-binding nuclear protein-like [Mytilus californianus]
MHIKEAKNMFWGVTLDGGKRYTQTVESSFHLSMAALEPSKGKSDNLVSIMIQHEKAEFMLCTLQHGKTYQQPLDLNFTEGEEVTFFLTNDKSVVHLSGFLMEDDQYPDDFGESMMDESSEEYESDEEEVPSLVSDDSEGQKVPGGKKRKKEKVKAVKKKKMKMVDSDDEDDDDEEDFDIENEFADFIDDEADEGSEEEDEEEEDEDDDEILKLKKKQKPQKKKQKDAPQKTNQVKQVTQTPKQTENDSQEGEGKKKKKKKKKKKNKNKEGDEQTNSTETPNKQQQSKKQVLAGGIVCEELKVGHGPVAQSGKMVHVYYTGKLQKTGKQFDSCNQGKPFRFRLGKGEVIKGWDIGVSGMKVGGKRKLVIPSQQGYGNQRQGPIPPGSTLMFEVELKSVS